MERRHFVRSKWFLKDGIKNFFHAKKKHRKNKITIPAFYFGVWMFTDEISKRSHRLEVADNNPMLAEVIDFADVLENPDSLEARDIADEWLAMSVEVNKVMYKLRYYAKIEFPSDYEEE